MADLTETPQHIIGFNIGGTETSKPVDISIIREAVDVLTRLGKAYIKTDGSLYPLYLHFLGCSEQDDSHILIEQAFEYVKAKLGIGFRGPLTFDFGIKGRPPKPLLLLSKRIAQYEDTLSCYTIRTTLEKARDILQQGDKIANFSTYKVSCLGVPVEPPCDFEDVTDLIVEAAKWGIHYIWLISPCRFWCENVEIKDIPALLALYEKLYYWYREFRKYNRGVIVYPFSDLDGSTVSDKPVAVVSMFVDGDRNVYHCGSLIRQDRAMTKLGDPELEKHLIHNYQPLKICEGCSAFNICCMCWTVVTKWEEPREDNPFCAVMKHLSNISKA